MADSNGQPNSGSGSVRVQRLLVFFLFVASGFAGLVYEVLWSRLLTYRFGATLDAVTTILVAFMGGLALGAFFMGRRVATVKNPLRVYGILEIIIGLSAALIPLGLTMLAPVFAAFLRANPDAYLAHRLFRFALTGGLLLVPTTCMGATLPLLSRFLTIRRDQLGLNIGGLYASNTVGALLGAFSAGFFLIIMLTLWGAMAVAVSVNVGVGLLSIYLAKSLGTDTVADSPVLPTPASELPRFRKLAFWMYVISGFLALAYQVVWFRALVFNFQYLKNTTYSFSSILTVFLAGIAIGSAVMTPMADKLKRPYLMYALLEVLIGIGGLFSFIAIQYNIGNIASWFVSTTGDVQWWQLVMTLFLRTGVAIFLPTLAMGLLFPVVLRCYIGTVDSVGQDVGNLYAANTVGAIIGAGLTSFFIIPALGIGWTILGLSVTSIVIGLVILLVAAEYDIKMRLGYTAVLGAVIAALFVMRLPREFPIVMQKLDTDLEELIYYADGPLATISVIENTKGERTIYVDNVGVAGTDPILLTDQKSLAHVPMLFIEEPKRVLTVGFGSGGASYSFATYPELEEVHCVEIDPTVPRAAHTLIASNHGILMPRYDLPDDEKFMPVPPGLRAEMNRFGRTYGDEKIRAVSSGGVKAVLDRTPMPEEVNSGEPDGFYSHDPRFDVILHDVRGYLQHTATKYDVIATDCTDLRYKTNANLYDLEYFKVCRDRLTDDGLVVVWMPVTGLRPDLFQVALKTFAEVFPEMAVWFMNNEATHYCLLLGWKNELTIDVDVMLKKLAIPEVKADLAELNLDSAAKILSCYVTDTRDLPFDDVPLNTESYPILEFLSPRYGLDSEEPLFTNIRYLYEHRNDVEKFMTGSPEALEKVEAELAMMEAAEPYIIEGHEHFRRIDIVSANESYMKAAELAPNDASVQQMLDFPELLRLVRTRPGSWVSLELARAYAAQGRVDEAKVYYRQILDGGKPLRPAPGSPPGAEEAWKDRVERYELAVEEFEKLDPK